MATTNSKSNGTNLVGAVFTLSAFCAVHGTASVMKNRNSDRMVINFEDGTQALISHKIEDALDELGKAGKPKQIDLSLLRIQAYEVPKEGDKPAKSGYSAYYTALEEVNDVLL